MYKFSYKNLTVFVFFITAVCFSGTAAAYEKSQCKSPLQLPHIAFIVPSDETNYFWNHTVDSMIKASEQLGVKLTVHYISDKERSRFFYPETIDKLLSVNDKPDYLMSFFWIGAEKRILEVIKKHNVQLFSLNSPIDLIKNKVGLPRQEYNNWIGHLSPDDYQVGYDLADHIIKETIRKNNNQQGKTYQMVAINGKADSDVAKLRFKGLLDRVAESGNVNLLQVVNSTWTPESGGLLMRGLINRYNYFDMVWSASDNMSKGVVDALKQLNSFVLKDIVIGSIDWSPEIIPLIAKGDVDVSFGGHTFDGAYGIAMILDHFNGVDFAQKGNYHLKSILKPITQGTLDEINDENIANLDFSQLSQCISINKKGASLQEAPFVFPVLMSEK